jgi:hypothetical protein
VLQDGVPVYSLVLRKYNQKRMALHIIYNYKISDIVFKRICLNTFENNTMLLRYYADTENVMNNDYVSFI